MVLAVGIPLTLVCLACFIGTAAIVLSCLIIRSRKKGKRVNDIRNISHTQVHNTHDTPKGSGSKQFQDKQRYSGSTRTIIQCLTA